MGKKLVSKISTTALSIATVVTLSGFGAFVPVAHGATVAELQVQIAALLSQISALQTQLTSTSGTSSSVPASLLSSSNLTVGSKGAAVMDLQKFLNANGYQIAASGAGSPGNESSYFGSATKAALAKWQAAAGISPASGFFGPISRAKLASTGSTTTTTTTTTTTGTTTTVPTGSGLTVTLAGEQPASALAPFNATRIPFTKVLLTASADGDVTVNGLVIQRTGLAEDASLAGVILIDQDGLQLGLEKTLSSDHKATVGDTFVVKAGQTKTVTVAARRAASGSRGGQTISLSVAGANTAANVNGSFPLTGATHTINESLTVGSLASPTAGPLDPGSSQTKEVGTKAYIFSSVKFTAGSAERVFIKSIRWNQSSSVATSDLANVQTVVDGTGYATTVSSDGKYYTTVFPGSGLLVDKGFTKELSIRGDVVSGSARDVDFDIYNRNDIYVVGETFGYGILAANGTDTAGTDDGAFHDGTNPWYDAYQLHVSTGTMTVSKLNSIAAQNISINLSGQPISGWAVDVKGEAVSVAQMIYRLTAVENSGAAVGLNDLTSVALYDDTGKVLAGPIDPSATANTGSITFTDTVTFPIGVTNIILKGKLGTDFDNNDTLAASTTPSSNWTSVTGQVTGSSITPSPTSGISGNTMTVKAASLTISVASVPIAQTIIAGSTQFEFARYILDTSSSGEDIRLTSIPLEYNLGGGGTATDLTNCKLYDGSTILTTGSNVLNPSAAGSSTALTFDGTGLILAKGTSKSLALKCDLKSASTGQYSWGYDSSSSPSPTGVTSGQTVASASLTENDSAGQQMTATSGGSLAVSLDAASPAYVLVSPGQTVELARIKFAASNEDIQVKQVALQMTPVISSAVSTNALASSTPVDLVGQKVTLWTLAGVQVGEAVLSNSGGTTRYATSSAITNFTVPKDSANILVVKGIISGISNSGPLTSSGDFVRVDYDGGNTGLNGTYGTGASSGTTITPSGADTASNGIRIMRAYPTLAKVDLTSSERTLNAGDGRTLYKFSVTANNGDVAFGKVTFSISSSTVAASSGNNATTTKFSLYAFTDSGFSTPDPNFTGSNNPGGLLNAGSCYSGLNSSTATAPVGQSLGNNSAGPEIYPDTSATACGSGARATTTLTIPSGQTRWFRLQASIGTLAAAGTSENIQVQLEGDSAFPVNASTLMQKEGAFAGQASGVDADTNDDFIWSPVSTTTGSNVGDVDWTNGYGLIGLPSTNMTAETISK